MIKTYNYKQLDKATIEKLCSRNNVSNEDVFSVVQEIERNIKERGDDGLRDTIKRIDNVLIEEFLVSSDELSAANIALPLQQAILVAKENITKFHQAQLTSRKSDLVETTVGINCWREFRGIEKVGLYIPGGSAPLFSTLLMLAIPAQIAGCQDISICTPTDSSGNIAAEILWCANMLGINKVYKMGGAQAIFALSYGTQSIDKVYKIFGPGNNYVSTAKMMVSKHTAIDMLAGPSEVLIIANSTANPRFVASDILAQCEHGNDSQAVLLCNCPNTINDVIREIERQIQQLPRAEFARQSLSNSYSVLCEELSEAVDFSNLYAPEHLILSMDSASQFVEKITNAGSIFVGHYTPESLGDYASGTNHTLPTSGFARSHSGLSVSDFGKWMSVQQTSQTGLRNIAHTVETMAEAEGLIAHKHSVTVRNETEKTHE